VRQVKPSLIECFNKGNAMVLDQTPEMQPLPAPTPFLQMVDNGATVSQQINYVTAAFIEPVVSGGLAFFKMGADVAAGNYNALMDDGIKALTMLLGFKGGESLAKTAEFTLKIKQMAFDAERIAQGVISKSPLEFLKKGPDGLQLNIIKYKVIDPANPTAPPVEVTKILTSEQLAQDCGNLQLLPDGSVKYDPYGITPVCFAAGTLVHTKEGLKPIEEIRVGDWVLSYPDNQKTPERLRQEHEYTYRQVTQTFVTEDQPLSELIVDNLVNGNRETFFVTANHPIYCEDRGGWVPVSELHATDAIENYGFGNLMVSRVYHERGRARVYNFEVEEFHTYYVGENGVWVHNACEVVIGKLSSLEALTNKMEIYKNPNYLNIYPKDSAANTGAMCRIAGSGLAS
jgi:hypothetical protein